MPTLRWRIRQILLYYAVAGSDSDWKFPKHKTGLDPDSKNQTPHTSTAQPSLLITSANAKNLSKRNTLTSPQTILKIHDSVTEDSCCAFGIGMRNEAER